MTTRRLPKHERRAQLLAIATEQFSANGFQGTSMDEIARTAGATKPVVYQHFASKEALYIAVIEERAEVVLRSIDSLRRYRGTPLERIDSGLRTFHRLTATGTPLRLFLGEEQVSPAAAARVAELLDAMAERLAGVILEYRQMDPADAVILGRTLIALAQSTARMIGPDPQPGQEDEVVGIVARMITFGLTDFAERAPDGPAAAEPEGRADGPAPDAGAGSPS